MTQLLEIKATIKDRFNHELVITSCGNSSSYFLFDGDSLLEPDTSLDGINHIRLGEVILLGRETAQGQTLPDLNYDIFSLKGEIVELKSKPTLPIGEIGLDAFGRVPTILDQGVKKRALLSLGAQDITIDNIQLKDKGCKVMGSSSDYILVDVENSQETYELGDYIEFSINYGGIMELFTSKYINKEFVY